MAQVIAVIEETQYAGVAEPEPIAGRRQALKTCEVPQAT